MVFTDHTRETAVLNAFFTAGGIASIAEDCHNQKIASCPCKLYGLARNPDENGDIIFEECSANYDFAANFYQSFVDSYLDNSTCEGTVDLHNIKVGKQVSYMRAHREELAFLAS